jgi:hypothetical protein
MLFGERDETDVRDSHDDRELQKFLERKENEYWTRYAVNLQQTLLAQKGKERKTREEQEEKALEAKCSCCPGSQHLFLKDDIASTCGVAEERTKDGAAEINESSPDSAMGGSDDGTSTIRPESASGNGNGSVDPMPHVKFDLPVHHSINPPGHDSVIDEDPSDKLDKDPESHCSKIYEADRNTLIHGNTRKREASSESDLDAQLSKRHSPERPVGIGVGSNLNADGAPEGDLGSNEHMLEDWPLRASPVDEKSPPPRPRSEDESMASSTSPDPNAEEGDDAKMSENWPLSPFGPIHTIYIPPPKKRAWSTEVLNDFDLASAANEQRREDALHDEDILSPDEDEDMLSSDDDEDMQAAIEASLSDK